ncbi:SLBB domain-containing protein [Spirosoma gilvum]
MTTRAQVAPGPAAAPSSAPGSINPASPSRGGGLPSGVTPGNLPANIQQQINQQRGQNTTNGRTGNPTPTQQSRTGNNGTTTNATEGNQQFDKQDNSETVPATDEELAEERIKQAQRREQEERRQKLFGYSLFNDPTMASTFQPNINIATPRNYIVGPGDELNIRMYGYSEGDYSQKVSPEGFVYIAQQTGIGPIFVSGLSVDKAKERLVSRMATKFVGLRSSSYGPQNTFLEVSLGSIRSIRVTVTGDAVRPGTYTMSGLSTVMNAIYQAGGPNDIGSYRKVQLIRNNRIVATLDLYDYLLNGIQQNDLRLQDNDNIRFTTFIERIEIGGAVKRSNIFEMLPGETLDKLLFYAGDFTANAYKGRLKVTRVTDRELKVTDVTAPEFKSFVMQDGDVVSVERVLNRFENKITIEGAVFRPGEYSLDNNKTLKDIITSAEGLRGDAFTGRVNIVRTREDLAVENLSINLANILAGTDPDIPLQREDQVIIPSRFDLAQQATISATGELNKPDPGMPYMANMTLNDVLIKTGGLKESAAYSVVEVVRRKKDVDPRSPTAQIADIYRFNVNRDLTLTNDANRAFVLEPFDQIIVRRSPNYLEQTYAAVVGEVIMPGPYAIRSKDMKISDLVVQSGGLTPQAYVEGATLVRPVRLSTDELRRKQRAISEVADNATKTVVETETLSPTSSESIGINLKKILAKPGSTEDILVQEGDTLRIPKLLETVRIQGEVQLPNTVKYRPGQTFQDYISQTGGFTSKSQKKRSFIVYANGSVDRTRKFMFFNVYPRVEPGAEIVVPKRTTNPLTAQQVLSSTVGIASSLLTLITTILLISRVN